MDKEVIEKNKKKSSAKTIILIGIIILNGV
ncbi:MAG: hypothetical protein MNSN_10980 [Minisyncoccus archaeiphilus]|nr:MAG: hypothetical protein MNSN_10980 [Candidatus Parcubacteria bacterium]